MSMNPNVPANAPIRLTIFDQAKTISLPGDVLLARHFTGACAADPQTLEELLPGTEPFRPGVTAWIINALLYFDRQRYQTRSVRVNPLYDIFEVEDAYLEKVSLEALPGGLITFNLSKRLITTATAAFSQPGEQLRREAELPVLENGKVLSKTITYSLNKSWKLIVVDPQSSTIQMRTTGADATGLQHRGTIDTPVKFSQK